MSRLCSWLPYLVAVIVVGMGCHQCHSSAIPLVNRWDRERKERALRCRVRQRIDRGEMIGDAIDTGTTDYLGRVFARQFVHEFKVNDSRLAKCWMSLRWMESTVSSRCNSKRMSVYCMQSFQILFQIPDPNPQSPPSHCSSNAFKPIPMPKPASWLKATVDAEMIM